eukprot:6533712-Prorocentrum_lima.AAC.1
MTSSLVGSEMCIRDSERRLQQTYRAMGLFALGVPQDKTWILSPTCAAVSYTHLTLPTICSV